MYCSPHLRCALWLCKGSWIMWIQLFHMIGSSHETASEVVQPMCVCMLPLGMYVCHRQQLMHSSPLPFLFLPSGKANKESVCVCIWGGKHKEEQKEKFSIVQYLTHFPSFVLMSHLKDLYCSWTSHLYSSDKFWGNIRFYCCDGLYLASCYKWTYYVTCLFKIDHWIGLDLVDYSLKPRSFYVGFQQYPIFLSSKCLLVSLDLLENCMPVALSVGQNCWGKCDDWQVMTSTESWDSLRVLCVLACHMAHLLVFCPLSLEMKLWRPRQCCFH